MNQILFQQFKFDAFIDVRIAETLVVAFLVFFKLYG